MDVAIRLFLGGLLAALYAYEVLVLASCVVSWFRVSPWGRWGGAVRFVAWATEPVFARLRAVLPLTAGMIDFTPMVLMIALDALRRYVAGLYAQSLMGG